MQCFSVFTVFSSVLHNFLNNQLLVSINSYKIDACRKAADIKLRRFYVAGDLFNCFQYASPEINQFNCISMS